MYVIKHLPNGPALPCANRDTDEIDFATSMPGYRVTQVPDLGPICDWRNATKRVVTSPEQPDPNDETKTLPAVYQEVPAGNTIDLDDEGVVLLKDADGTIVSRITGKLIQ